MGTSDFRDTDSQQNTQQHHHTTISMCRRQTSTAHRSCILRHPGHSPLLFIALSLSHALTDSSPAPRRRMTSPPFRITLSLAPQSWQVLFFPSQKLFMRHPLIKRRNHDDKQGQRPIRPYIQQRYSCKAKHRREHQKLNTMMSYKCIPDITHEMSLPKARIFLTRINEND